MSSPIWIWQRIRSPHMTWLAAALVKCGFSVTFISNQVLSQDRAEQGWEVPQLEGVDVLLAEDVGKVRSLVAMAPNYSIHICEGLRANGLIGAAQLGLKARGLKFWVIMEGPEENRFSKLIKRVAYSLLFLCWRNDLAGILAIGQGTGAWINARRALTCPIVPFAYFLGESSLKERQGCGSDLSSKTRYRIIFVGQLVKRKRVDLLIRALALIDRVDFELCVVGDGPELKRLQELGDELLASDVLWLGSQPMSDIPNLIRRADCLVLPSRHDGWGAVISEALMVGTPVICSDACGAAVVVDASGVGGVFVSDDSCAFSTILEKQISGGIWPIEQRCHLAEWAQCLGAQEGANYLSEILNSSEDKFKQPAPPWEVADTVWKTEK
jgi:glycosyltransferase involved in cell wall biosynthesis